MIEFLQELYTGKKRIIQGANLIGIIGSIIIVILKVIPDFNVSIGKAIIIGLSCYLIFMGGMIMIIILRFINGE